MNIKNIIAEQKVKLSTLITPEERAIGDIIYNNGQCQVLSQSPNRYEMIIHTPANTTRECIFTVSEEGTISALISPDRRGWNRYTFAALLQLENELRLFDPKETIEHKKYTRAGMIKRVLKERAQKAENANYRIQWADNIYGDHILTNEKGIKYKIFLRDFKNQTGYSNSADSRLNKLGTTKHIMFAFNMLKKYPPLYEKLGKSFPFIEIFCDPLNDYRIAWYYPDQLSPEELKLLGQYFNTHNFAANEPVTDLLGFLREVEGNPRFCIRPEVTEKIGAAFEKKALENLRDNYTPDFSPIKVNLYEYQKEGIVFSLFRENAIIADEMGLGKTVQAIGAALLKKKVFNFKKTLIVCPASLKSQWQKEIEKFSGEKALVVEGPPNERELRYREDAYYFFIINYETVLRDQIALNRAGFDFLILDEVQRAKNYETFTAASLKRLVTRHKLALTGTPIENRLIDIFSIMSIMDDSFFGPLWEFSYQHCLFDPEKYNKINGYYNLKELNKRLEEVLIRREKRKVIDQLPDIRQITIPVKLSPLQADYHASYAKALAHIIRKKFLTAFDLQRIQLLLANMRMVCDSTYLIDEETNESPKLDELKHILLDELEVHRNPTKIIIFSEWIKVHKLVGKLLRDNQIGFVELNGSIPVSARGELIRKFETNPQYKVFLSTEAGGTGLNLQVANTLINFELPWNPAKKNQRTGRIDRLGQKSEKLTIYNLITQNSIEQQIAAGLLVKQSLFDGVLSSDSKTNFVDFSSKGRSQFIRQLEAFLRQTGEEEPVATQPEEKPTEEEAIAIAQEPATGEIDPAREEDDRSDAGAPETSAGTVTKEHPATPSGEDMEKVLNSGLDFLSGLLRMTTGKNVGLESKKIEVNKETGEVTMTFKLPL